MQHAPESSNNNEKSSEDVFYESMAIAQPGYTYRDDRAEAADQDLQSEVRTTAIITLVLVALTLVFLGVILIIGLQRASSLDAVTRTSSSLEL